MMRLFLSRFPVLTGLFLFVLLCAALAGAEYFTDSTTYRPVTTTADSGPGSLRAAIDASGNGDVIYFVGELNGQTITLTSGELAINANITIAGPGPDLLTVARDPQTPAFRIFHVLPGHTTTIQGLTIRAGGARNGGNVLNDHSALNLTNCIIREGFTSPPTLVGLGGGICNDGTGGNATLTIIDCSITANASRDDGGGIYNDASNGSATVAMWNSSVTNNNSGHFDIPFGRGTGGGIVNNDAGANLTLTNCVVSDNLTGGNDPFPVGDGGGIYNGGGTVTIVVSTIRGNHGYAQGGGIASTGGTLTITNSTISGNVLTGQHDGAPWGEGGGIMNNGTLTMSNSTLSNNFASDTGGGLRGRGTITNCTISGNNAGPAGGGGIFTTGGIEIGNTILQAGGAGANISGTAGSVISHGYNISTDDGGGFLTASGDQINTDPVLGALQDNGGPTFTHELLNGSPAIDAGDTGFTPPPYEDQRGFLRVFNGHIDIGSFEVQPVSTPSPSPTPSPTPCGLYITFSENFDGVTAPALPPGWTTSFTSGPANCTPTGTCPLGTNWASNNNAPGIPPHCVFHDAPGCVTDSVLDTPSFVPGFVLVLRQSFDLENGRDGAVMEISLDGGPFVDFTAIGGSPGYNGTIASDTLSPLAGRTAWTGNSGVFVDHFISFPQAALGHHVRLRFRLATDCSGAGTGWRIDNIRSESNFGCQSPTPTPTATATATATVTPPTTVTPTPTGTPPATATPTATLTPPATATPSATVTPTATVPPTPTPTPTATPTPTSSPTTSQLGNISTRLRVETGDRVMIGGFIINGSAPKKVALRGLGPSLAGVINDVLADPTLELRDGSGVLLEQNDNWQDNPPQAAQLIELGLALQNSNESGIVATLPPGAYTVVVAGKDQTSGLGLVEVYDADAGASSSLANISTRGFVQTADNVMIGGFILGEGTAGPAAVVVRGIGPSLTQAGVVNALADPTLELRDSNGELLLENDNWQDDPDSAAQLVAHGLGPTNSLEAGIFASLPSGAFTAILAGKNGGTGIGLVEIYHVP